ncbi:indole-3-glycerol phosphate synthase TrpC [Bacillus xiapuensis]|uniref:indole-3-glycerol phosphate synthase TrpC n=1 Tax=Bacillus xiapuensis TaxID=2014075 RepID=UPI000C24D9A2|nr:indole-3-glycerol phosphate synthase TrpC [Bacillus xiapuensis]
MTVTVLDRILRKKEEEVEQLKRDFPFGIRVNRKTHPSLYERFRKSKTMNIISEIKRASPSKGAIHLHVNPKEQGRLYEENGANAISVLTDQPFFQGSMKDLEAVRQEVKLPILCKDFIMDPIQIDRAKAAGADVILLIASALDPDALRRLYAYAQEQELDVLLEVHDEKEMEQALALEAKIIGINNRNLKTFQVDLAVTERLLKAYGRSDIVFVAESGIRTRADVKRVSEAGAKAVLVGETLMTSRNLSETFSQLKIDL